MVSCPSNRSRYSIRTRTAIGKPTPQLARARRGESASSPTHYPRHHEPRQRRRSHRRGEKGHPTQTRNICGQISSVSRIEGFSSPLGLIPLAGVSHDTSISCVLDHQCGRSSTISLLSRVSPVVFTVIFGPADRFRSCVRWNSLLGLGKSLGVL